MRKRLQKYVIQDGKGYRCGYKDCNSALPKKSLLFKHLAQKKHNIVFDSDVEEYILKKSKEEEHANTTNEEELIEEKVANVTDNKVTTDSLGWSKDLDKWTKDKSKKTKGLDVIDFDSVFGQPARLKSNTAVQKNISPKKRKEDKKAPVIGVDNSHYERTDQEQCDPNASFKCKKCDYFYQDDERFISHIKDCLLYTSPSPRDS